MPAHGDHLLLVRQQILVDVSGRGGTRRDQPHLRSTSRRYKLLKNVATELPAALIKPWPKIQAARLGPMT